MSEYLFIAYLFLFLEMNIIVNEENLHIILMYFVFEQY